MDKPRHPPIKSNPQLRHVLAHLMVAINEIIDGELEEATETIDAIYYDVFPEPKEDGDDGEEEETDEAETEA